MAGLVAGLVAGGGGAYPASMGIREKIEGDYHAALAALAWQVDLGADEALGEMPTNAYDLPEKPSWTARAAAPAAPATAALKPAAKPGAVAKSEAVEMARAVAAGCHNLQDLDAAAASFDGCDLRKGARAAAMGVGPVHASLLILCDPPSLDAEKSGQAMVAADWQMLLKIFAAIGLAPDAPNPASALHLAPALPWPLRGAQDQQAEALAMMAPFALRRIGLVAPKRVVLMGHYALAQILPGAGMQRARGQWHRIAGSDTLAYPMLMPALIMKTPAAKRDAWADALAIKSALREG